MGTWEKDKGVKNTHDFLNTLTGKHDTTLWT